MKRKDIFKTWKEDQFIYQQIPITSMKKELRTSNITKLHRKLSYHIAELSMLGGMFNYTPVTVEIPPKKWFKDQFFMLYDLLEQDVGVFINYLQEHGFTSELMNKMEKKKGIDPLVKKYNDIFKILFDQEDDDARDELLFTIANKFFEFCFTEPTFATFKKMLSDPAQHPLLRMFYAVMWTNLAEIGWQHWHVDCLQGLKQEADAGKEIVYVAGGTDIYQLIKSGIYNIRVIDPLLPTQPKYYSQGWDWFVKGDEDDGIGEEAIVNKDMYMKRMKFEPTGNTFDIKLSNNKTVTIEESLTVWHLYDKSDTLLGKIVFDRRLTTQDDFKVSNKEALLISFNELYFVSAPKCNDGWGIDPHKFHDTIKIYVKQLQKPVSKKVSCNIRYEVKQAKFAFISLGSCVD